MTESDPSGAACPVQRPAASSMLDGSGPSQVSGTARQGIGAALVCLAAALLFLLPVARPVPFPLDFGVHVTLPQLAVRLDYRYDALSHFFTFIAIVITCSVTLSAGLWRPSRKPMLLLVATALAFLHTLAIADLVLLYLGWEATGWLAWLTARAFLGPRGETHPSIPVLAHLAGFTLLAGAVMLTGAGGPQLATRPWLLPLLVLPAVVRLGQAPFRTLLQPLGNLQAPVAAALVAGVFSVSAPYLVARGLQIDGGRWSPTGQFAILGLLLVGIVVSSLLAWRATSPRRALLFAAMADLVLVLLVLYAGNPASVSAGLTLLLNNSLAIAVLLLAGGAPANGRALHGRLAWLAVALGGTALVGFPPLLGFIARWQLTVALWSGPWVVPLLILAACSVPRTIGLLRAIDTLSPSRGAVAGGACADRGSVALAAAPALALGIFLLLPWLPQHYLVAPAVGAIFGRQQIEGFLPGTGAALPLVALSGILLLVPLALGVFYQARAKHHFKRGPAILWLPLHLAALLDAFGDACHLLAIALTELLERAPRAAAAMAVRLGNRVPSLSDEAAERIDQRYYLPALPLLAIAIILALAS